jgi:hypothetical protein
VSVEQVLGGSKPRANEIAAHRGLRPRSRPPAAELLRRELHRVLRRPEPRQGRGVAERGARAADPVRRHHAGGVRHVAAQPRRQRDRRGDHELALRGGPQQRDRRAVAGPRARARPQVDGARRVGPRPRVSLVVRTGAGRPARSPWTQRIPANSVVKALNASSAETGPERTASSPRAPIPARSDDRRWLISATQASSAVGD